MKTVVFDFDGTIADTLGRVVGIYNRLAPRLGCRPLGPSDLERVRNGRPRDLMREFGIGYAKLSLLAWLVRRELRADIAEMRLHEGMREALVALAGRGVRLRILTSNSQANVEAFLRANRMDALFESVASCGRLFGKHVPLRNMRASDEDLAYVGDEVRDIEAAKKAGARSVAVTWGFQSEAVLRGSSPDLLLRRPDELVGLD